MPEYNLQHLGIEHILTIEGTLTELQANAGNPVVFLIDERHDHNASIAQNVTNAEHLVEHANVLLIGVESHHMDDAGLGGQCSDEIDPVFATHLVDVEAVTVAGVESRELFELMNDDTAGLTAAQIAVYPLNFLRSYYFLMALFRHRRQRAIAGNMLLNAGLNHINHIRQLIQWGGVQQLAGMPASYVHIRATSFPAG